MDSQKPVKTGNLLSSAGRDRQDWQKRFYVLYAQSQTNKARLDWFPDETAFKMSPLVRKTIFVEEIKKVKATNIDGKPNCFQIETLRREEPFLFSSGARNDMKTWVNQLNKLLDERRLNPPTKNPLGGDSHLGDGVYGNELWSFDEEPVEYLVTVGETDSAQACNISKQEHILQVYSHSMALKHAKTLMTLYVWPYKYIRRYGRSRSSFTFEAGRRCASGQGVFILYTTQAEEVFNEVQKGNAQGGDSQTMTLTPDVPSRSYGDHYGDMVAEKRYQRLDSETRSTNQEAASRSSEAPVRPSAPPPPGAPNRERSYSAASADSMGKAGRLGPPLPVTARPQKPLPPSRSVPIAQMSPSRGVPIAQTSPSRGVPIAQMYIEPPGARTYDDSEQYSSIEEDTIRSMVGHLTTDEGYSTPVTEDNSMVSIAAQIRMGRNKPADDDAYDDVRLNVMTKSCNAGEPATPQVYGQLYGDLKTTKQPNKPTQPADDTYDEVRNP